MRRVNNVGFDVARDGIALSAETWKGGRVYINLGLEEISDNYLDGMLFMKQLAGNPNNKVLVSRRSIPACIDAL